MCIRDSLRTVDTVIIDEIHALVPTKRGAHLALSLERLEALTKRRIQRIGLSATQRPLEEVARFLGGVDVQGRTGIRDQGSARGPEAEIGRENPPTAMSEESSLAPDPWSSDLADVAPLRYRPVTIVNAAALKRLKLKIEVPDVYKRQAQDAAGRRSSRSGPRRYPVPRLQRAARRLLPLDLRPSRWHMLLQTPPAKLAPHFSQIRCV